MYDLLEREFEAPNGVKRKFVYREGTNDENVIRAAFCEDEYGILKLDFGPNNIVVDIGAHIGAVTMLFTTIRPDLKIFSFEPLLDNFELLKKNVTENKLDNEMNIFNQAVWFYDDDEVKMYYPDNSEGGKVHKFIGGQFFIHAFYNKKLFKKASTITLSKIFEENRIFNCKFMKIDVEGAEYGILKAAPEEVLRMIERIHGEYHNIEPDRVKMPRKTLLDQTKGVFKDVTGQPEKEAVGPFVFVKK